MPAKLVFLDIETHYKREWNELPTQLQEAFINHYYKEDENEFAVEESKLLDLNSSERARVEENLLYRNIEAQYRQKAGLIPELGSIVCISIVRPPASDLDESKVKCLKGADEDFILDKFDQLAVPLWENGYGIAGWNTNGFDIPYIAKRYIIRGKFVPDMVNIFGVKPWESRHLDIMQAWKCGGWSNCSLEMACASLNIPVKFTEKGGGDFYKQKITEIDWEAMELYCNNDAYSAYLVYKHLTERGYL